MSASVHARVAAARQALMDAGLAAADAAADAEVLARHALGWDRATLLSRGRETPPAGFDETFDALIRRRAAREPVAQITGIREFWGLDFRVTREVLVPRPETELIVEQALAFAREHPVRRIVDVGTGTGCLAIALTVELPDARAVALDLSPAALDVAAANARRHRVDRRVWFVRANALDAIRGPVDLIVSNPPYVPLDTPLPPEVANYEPHAALFGGPDGLDVLRVLIRGAAARLAPGGRFIVEFGFGQHAAVETLAAQAGWDRLTVVPDLQGIPRVAVLSRAA
jgi:release factor glutamine methyltransferase